MMPRTLLPLLLLAAVPLFAACAPESTAPNGGGPADEIRAIHIARTGLPVDTIMRTGALGGMSLSLLLELRDGSLRAYGDGPAVWGSTHPAVVDETFRTGGEVFLFRYRDGRARIIAGVGPYRDTVTIEVAQVPTRAILNADTLVTLAPDARDITGAPTAYHGFRFGAERLDSNNFTVHSTSRIVYEPMGGAPFEIFPDARGDSVSIAGQDVGTGRLLVRFAGRVDTLPVQVTDTYRVLRFSISSTGFPRRLPDTVVIPRGTAIIFRNDTAVPVEVGDADGDPTWHVGPIPPGGRQAQLFATPGEYVLFWAGELCHIIVT